MTLKETLTTFACGAAAIMTMHVLMADVGAQGDEDEKLIACINSEKAMRVIDPEASCVAGERKIPLKLPKVQRPCEKARAVDIAGLQRRVAELEGRGDARLLDRTAMAPFEVVNEAGIVVFSVKAPPEGGLPAATEIFNETGGRVAVIAANAEGGSVSVESGVSQPYTSNVSGAAARATLHAFGEYADLSVSVGTVTKLDLGRRRDGRYGFRVFGDSEVIVAGIGESDAGSGVALVADATGQVRATLNCTAGTASGEARILDASDRVIASLSGAGLNGSGVLQLRNNADTVMVEAGVLPSGIGAVRAGPGAFQHGLHWIGLPASYIEGKK
jgi:hypothetical protein